MPVLLQINSVANFGSTGRIAEGISSFVKGNGWESYIAYGRLNNGSIANTIRIGSHKDIYLHFLKSYMFDKHGLGSVKATNNFIAEIKKLNPSIIHIHNIHGYYINYKILFDFISFLNIPIVWTFHDCWAFTGHCSHFSDINCSKWESLCKNCPKLRNYPKSLIIDNSLNNFLLKKKLFTSINNLQIVCVSEWLAGIVRKSFLKNFPIKVIYNGLNLNIFTKSINISILKEKHKLSGKYVLLGVANVWSKSKGFDDFIELSKHLNEDFVILLVGLSKKIIKNLPKNIIGYERTESLNYLVELYSLADIVLNLSTQETFGMTTVEGFACGTPAIVYNSTASPELIKENTGIFVEPGNINRLIEAIEVIIRNGKEFYTNSCRNAAEKYFDEKINYNTYLSLYGNLLNKNSFPNN